MPKILLVFAFAAFVSLPSCSSAEKRAEIESIATEVPVDSLWYVCLRNEKSGVERIMQTRAVSHELAVDSALNRARSEGWGNSPIGLVWVRTAPDNTGAP